MKIDYNNTLCELVCKVCILAHKEENPNVIDCSFRAFDNEYCPELVKWIKYLEKKGY